MTWSKHAFKLKSFSDSMLDQISALSFVLDVLDYFGLTSFAGVALAPIANWGSSAIAFTAGIALLLGIVGPPDVFKSS